MTVEGRRQLIERFVADPCLQNRNALVAAHQYLCRRGARKFFRNTVDRADLEQVAAVGLIKASQRYDRVYATPFEAYAWLVIVGELMHFVRDHERIVRVPRQLRALERRYVKAYETLTARTEREPTTRELAHELGVSAAEVDELRGLRVGTPQRGDDDAPHSRDTESGAGTVVATVEEAYSLEDRLSLSAALDALTQRERRIVRDIYYLGRTQSEVGVALGISQRQVSRLLTKTLQRLARLLSAA